LDRAYLPRDAQAPPDDDPEELANRGALWLRAAKLRHKLGDAERRDSLLQRVLQEPTGADMQAQARDLQQEWRGK
jgi:hypothetical protein